MSDIPKDPNSWESHRMHVTKSLERLEEQNESQTAKINDIHAEIVGFKTNQKWEFRVLSLLWGLMVTGINFLLGRP